MLSSISGYGSNKINFKHNLHPKDLSYKQALVRGVQFKFQFTPKLESLNSILAPNEFRAKLKELPASVFKMGKRLLGTFDSPNEFDNVKNGSYRANLHVHTKHSDGEMSVSDYLEQSVKYADKVAQKDKNGFYLSSITDHNNIEGVQKVIAMIADEPEKYKNFKFIPACEFMFSNKVLFEAIGYGFNPFDAELLNKISDFNPISLIDKIKEFGGFLSYAHPLRYCQPFDMSPTFIEYIKKLGIEGIESNYQYTGVLFNSKFLQDMEQVKSIAKENNFIETGGNDTHCNNIFGNRAKNILDELI